MENATFLFVVAVLLAGGLAAVAIWSPRRLGLKLIAIGLTAAFMPVAYAALTELLSRPKPTSFEWMERTAERAHVLGAKVAEGEAIFLFLELPGVREPRAYALPWRQDLAEQLQGAQQEAEENGGQVMVENPFEGRRYESSLEQREQKFYAEPPAALPPKTPPGPPAVYERRS